MTQPMTQAEADMALMAVPQEPQHSLCGPSSADQWIPCGARNNLLRKLGMTESEGSEDAARGTVQHDVAAACLTKTMEPWEFIGEVLRSDGFEFVFDEDMSANVEFAIEKVRELLKRYPTGVLYVETRVRSELHPDAYGTSDIRIEVPGDRIIIVDHKFGMVAVAPHKPQLKLYGYYSYEGRSSIMRDGGEPKVIDLYVIQPRLPREDDRFRHYETTPQELTDFFVKTALPAMKRSHDPKAPFCTGEHCKFCPLNTQTKCPAIYDIIVSLPLDKPPEAMTNEEIGNLKVMKPIIDKWFLGLDQAAMQRVRDYKQDVPGWKLVHKLGDRVWKTTATEIVEGKEVTIKVEEALLAEYGDKAKTEPKIKSPAQIEKLPGGKAWTARYAYKPDTGVTLAPASDTREQVVGLMARAEQEDKAQEGVPV